MLKKEKPLKKNDNNEAALHIAVKDINSLEIVNALLDANADVNIKDRYKVTPLHTAIDTAAVNKNNPNGAAMIKALIENNANIDAINNLKETPLKKAISYNYLHGINDLLNAGADVNKKDDNGNTPLHIAVDTGKLDTIKALLEHNPDKTIENNYHKTPLDTVKERKKHANAENSKVFQDIIDVLENYEYKK